MPRFFLYLFLLLTLLSGCGPKSTNVTTPSPTREVVFGGSYDQLEGPQRELIDEWLEKLGLMLGRTYKVEEEYNRLPLSTRTTFEAVTHALLETELTDEAGKSLGNAIDLIDHLETVRGHIPAVRGDMQFRIYVVLKPNAQQVFERNIQFRRGHDNTIYHHGYPYSYRLDGTPSAQFSITEDFRRADIDVDYRSTTFPVVLFNGHLTAANSDVRAGGNYDSHVDRWDGLPDWWRSFLVFLSGVMPGEATSEGRFYIPPVPSVSKDDPAEEAVHDFLESWLVEKEPRLAAAYLSGSAIRCADPSAEAEDELSLARYRIVSEMRHVDDLIGEIDDLEDTVTPITPSSPALDEIEHPYQSQFTLVHVPPEMASVLTCDAMDHPSDAHMLPLGDYYGAFFEIRESDNQVLDVFQLWGQDQESWRLLSYHFAIEAREEVMDIVPDRWEVASTSLDRIEGDPAFVIAVDQFMGSWFKEGDFTQALEFVDESCNSCPDHYLKRDQGKVLSAEDARSRILEKLQQIRAGVETGDTLRTSVRRLEPWNPSLRLISHDQEDAFTLVSVSDGFAEPLLCENRHRAHGMERTEAHGTFNAAIFQLNVRSEHPAALILLWARDASEKWKIVSYHLEMH